MKTPLSPTQFLSLLYASVLRQTRQLDVGPPMPDPLANVRATGLTLINRQPPLTECTLQLLPFVAQTEPDTGCGGSPTSASLTLTLRLFELAHLEAVRVPFGIALVVQTGRGIDEAEMRDGALARTLTEAGLT